jgi:hypothetical protein
LGCEKKSFIRQPTYSNIECILASLSNLELTY